jgi:opacity protein-like surface antigen
MRAALMAVCVLSAAVVLAEEASVDTAPAEPVTTAERASPRPPSIGVLVGVTAGGDIEDSEVAYGAQVKLPMGEPFFVALSVAMITDTFAGDTVEIDQDLTSIGLSIGAEVQAATRCTVYGLFGPNFNMVDLDIRNDVELPPGASIKGDIDDEIGFHVAAGTTYQLAEHLNLFLEYRYTFLDLEGSVTGIRSDGNRLVTEVEGSYDFGVAAAGLSYLF